MYEEEIIKCDGFSHLKEEELSLDSYLEANINMYIEIRVFILLNWNDQKYKVHSIIKL